MYHKIARRFASFVVSKNQFWIKNPIQSQTITLKNLINNGGKTLFGQQHFFKITQNNRNLKNQFL